MKFVRSLIACFLSLSCLNSLSAQSDIPVLTWRTHLSYRNVIDISPSPDRIYAAVENGLFYLDRTESSVSKITKIDGLSDISMGAIGYSATHDLLVIGYANGNIDLFSDTEITNLPAVLRAELTGSKSHRHVQFFNNLIYVSGDQGIFVIDPNRREIVDSYRNLGENGSSSSIMELQFTQDSIYAATSAGIISASLDSETNLLDFNNWQRFSTGRQFRHLSKTEGDQLLASDGAKIYRWVEGVWEEVTLNLGLNDVLDISASGNSHFVLDGTRIFEVQNGQLVNTTNVAEGNSTPFQILLKEANATWLANGTEGLFAAHSGQNFFPSGPVADYNLFLDTDANGRIFSTQGGFSSRATALGRRGTLSVFEENSWSIREVNESGSNDNIGDLTAAKPQRDGEENALWLNSYIEGPVSWSEESVSVLREESPNSTLQSAGGLVRTTAIQEFEGDLWMTNYGFDTPLHRWNIESGNWEEFTLNTSFASYPVDLLILPNGDKWMRVDPNRGGGIVVFNEESGDERYLGTNGGSGGLPGREVTSLALDQNLFLWVGTNSGIAFYPSPTTVLDGDALTASIPIFENRLLLRGEFVTSVAIDPGNRKWIGTQNNGVFLFSESGEELVHHFTSENSPLLDNQIQDIEIDRRTGEVFISTAVGLVSFRSDASEPSPTHSNVRIFPNPVARDFNGVVSIDGLINASLVKITDVSGKLVREVRSNGGTATWNARDINGNRVKTGIYLVFSSNSDGTETFVGKIAIAE